MSAGPGRVPVGLRVLLGGVLAVAVASVGVVVSTDPPAQTSTTGKTTTTATSSTSSSTTSTTTSTTVVVSDAGALTCSGWFMVAGPFPSSAAANKAATATATSIDDQVFVVDPQLCLGRSSAERIVVVGPFGDRDDACDIAADLPMLGSNGGSGVAPTWTVTQLSGFFQAACQESESTTTTTTRSPGSSTTTTTTSSTSTTTIRSTTTTTTRSTTTTGPTGTDDPGSPFGSDR